MIMYRDKAEVGVRDVGAGGGSPPPEVNKTAGREVKDGQ